ncbi:MAG TPA: YjbQ family protein, partial [Ignavibacteriaceae bacterium]
MEIGTYSINISTKGNCEMVDITDRVTELISSNNFTEGNALVFAGGSTAGITTIEYEPGLLKDYPKFFERIAPA